MKKKKKKKKKKKTQNKTYISIRPKFFFNSLTGIKHNYRVCLDATVMKITPLTE